MRASAELPTTSPDTDGAARAVNAEAAQSTATATAAVVVRDSAVVPRTVTSDRWSADRTKRGLGRV